MVRVTGAGPMAERHRGGDAGFAGINDATELGAQVAEIEEVDLEAGLFFDDFARDGGDAECLRHFAWAGLVGPGRAADEKNAGRRTQIFELFLSDVDSFAGFEPFNRELVLRIG